jgi:predicted enzyme related to lactoylglutathione lyase
MAEARPLRGAVFKYLFLHVRDVPASIAFYGELLGMEVVATDHKEYAFFAIDKPGGTQIATYRAEHPRLSSEPLFALNVQALEAVADGLRERGVVVGEVHTVPFGRAAELLDPDGHVIELHEPDP